MLQRPAQSQRGINLKVCPQGLHHSARDSTQTALEGLGLRELGQWAGDAGRTPGHSRQSASSVRSSQSKSPSQRHSLRAQCPFPQGNSLGSQGGVGPGGTRQGSVAISPPPASPPTPLPGPHRSPARHCRPCSPPAHHTRSLWGCSAHCGMWPRGAHKARACLDWGTQPGEQGWLGAAMGWLPPAGTVQVVSPPEVVAAS